MKIFSILLITELSKPWSNGWYYKSGFEKNGHTVVLFDPSSVENPSINIFAITKEIRPDFILHTKGGVTCGDFSGIKKILKSDHVVS